MPGVAPDFADRIELIICTGLRKGEALALHCNNVHLDRNILYVRWTLPTIGNNKLAMTTPSTFSTTFTTSPPGRCSAHDLRHLAVTLALGEGVDLVLVPKTARHSTRSTRSTTASLYDRHANTC
ncbi:hypothetical protein AB0O31_07980 [Kitasatospora cineracea]|uniref:hypothetical protein n=1 Tax=Kitasatospora cineracea TaxID=88074 RepID=UPI00341F3149